MTALWITLYAIAGVIVGAIAAWETAKDEARRKDYWRGQPSPFAVIASFFACGVCWPFVVAVIVIGSIGSALIDRAARQK